MNRIRTLLSGLIVVALAGAVAPVPAQSAADLVIRTKKVAKDSHCSFPGRARKLKQLGPADVRSWRPGADVTFGAFKAELGRPDRVRAVDPSHIVATWTGGRAAKLHFLSFGGETDRDDLVLQWGSLTGGRWVTSRGVDVGSTLAAVKDAYGREAWRVHLGRPGTWWRIAGYCGYPLVDGEATALAVRFVGGKVRSFVAFVGAAGE